MMGPFNHFFPPAQNMGLINYQNQMASEMQSQRASFQAQLSALAQERDQLAQNNARLESELALKHEELGQIEKRYLSDKEMWQRDQAFVAEEVDKDICILNQKNAALQQENTALANKLQILAKESESMQLQLQDEIDRVSRQCKIEESRRLEAEAMCEKIAAECAALKAEFEANIAELNSLIAFLKEELATLKKTYLQQIQTLEIELREQQQLNVSLGSEVEKQRQLYERQMESVKKQRDDFKALCDQLKVDMKIKQDELATLAAHMETEVARLAQEKQSCWITVQDKTAECRDLATTLQKLKDRFASQQVALTASFEKRIAALQEQKDSEITTMEMEITALKVCADQLIADKDRLILENKEVRSKLATWQEENALVREHMQFVGKMWNQLSDELVEDKALVEQENMEMKKMLQFTKDSIIAHEIENSKSLDLLRSFSDRYLA